MILPNHMTEEDDKKPKKEEIEDRPAESAEAVALREGAQKREDAAGGAFVGAEDGSGIASSNGDENEQSPEIVAKIVELKAEVLSKKMEIDGKIGPEDPLKRKAEAIKKIENTAKKMLKIARKEGSIDMDDPTVVTVLANHFTEVMDNGPEGGLSKLIESLGLKGDPSQDDEPHKLLRRAFRRATQETEEGPIGQKRDKRHLRRPLVKPKKYQS